MATGTSIWSWQRTGNNSSSNTANAWQQYTVKGNQIPANATITKVEYSFTTFTGKYTSNSSNIFRLFGVAINGGPYTGAKKYGEGQPETLVNSFSVATNSSSNSESTAITVENFENGQVKFWRTDSGTYCKLIECDFQQGNELINVFKNKSSIGIQIRANTSLSGTTYIQNIQIKITYTYPYISKPENINVTQISGEQFTITWDPVEVSDMDDEEEVLYSIIYGGYTIGQGILDTTYTGKILGYGNYVSMMVLANCGTLSSYTTKSVIFSSPILSTPNITTFSPQEGTSLTLEWEVSSLDRYVDGTIAYKIEWAENENGDFITAFENLFETTYKIPFQWFKTVQENRENKEYYFKVSAYCYSNYTERTYSSESGAQGPFTFENVAIVKYKINNSWQDCQIHYYSNGQWIPCMMLYRSNGEWKN